MDQSKQLYCTETESHSINDTELLHVLHFHTIERQRNRSHLSSLSIASSIIFLGQLFRKQLPPANLWPRTWIRRREEPKTLLSLVAFQRIGKISFVSSTSDFILIIVIFAEHLLANSLQQRLTHHKYP